MKARIAPNYTTDELNIRNYCFGKMDEYRERDGMYSPSKHDHLIFSDAAEHFNMDINEIERIFNKVDSIISNEMISKMSIKEKLELWNEILEDNADSPWGQAKLRRNKQSS